MMEAGEGGPVQTFSSHTPIIGLSPVAPGLDTLYALCRRLYPDQPNPLQVTAVVKYWLGGPDPLDYVSMYSNPGDEEKGIPPHWHYISFGLSDLHGDGRVHEISGSDTPSGFGFELTFRLKREAEETAPPTWPAAIMQALAKYVFQSENILCAGDHVSWHCPLDNSESRIQHMLMTEDPQLGTVMTPFGPVNFVQIVGVCGEELMAAQRWNGPGVIDLMKNIEGAGSPWLVTDMRRGESMFDLDLNVQEAVDKGIEVDGSNLSGVSARCTWSENRPSSRIRSHSSEGQYDKDNETFIPQISELESEQIKSTLKKGLLNTKPVLPPIKSSHSSRNDSNIRKECYDSSASSYPGMLESGELLKTRNLESVHLQFNLEAGTVLPLALRGRLRHGRHFTFKSVVGDIAITFVAPSVVGAFADAEHPYAAHGPWLQVLLNEEFVEEMILDLDELTNVEGLSLPKTYSWPDKNLSITLLPEEY